MVKSSRHTTIRLSDLQFKCLEILAIKSIPHGEACLSFRTIEVSASLSRVDVKRSVRALFRKGLAEFHKGLCSDAGDFAGSGYCISAYGKAIAETLFAVAGEDG